MNGEMSPAIASSAVPSIRIAAANQSPIRPEREFVLYWMTAFRRTSFNFALERAVEWSAQLAKPLIVLEALRVDYPWASDRIHRFIVDGMADNQRRIAETPAVYYPYIERAPGEGKGLVAALGAHACVVVTDDFPAFFLPGAVKAAAQQIDVRLEAVDSNGIHALRAPGREFKTAHAFRRWLQSNIYEDLLAFPAKDPLTVLPPASTSIPDGIAARWPRTDLDEGRVDAVLHTLPIPHRVTGAPARRE